MTVFTAVNTLAEIVPYSAPTATMQKLNSYEWSEVNDRYLALLKKP